MFHNSIQGEHGILQRYNRKIMRFSLRKIVRPPKKKGDPRVAQTFASGICGDNWPRAAVLRPNRIN
jgi:hypothetical protein